MEEVLLARFSGASHPEMTFNALQKYTEFDKATLARTKEA